MVSGQIRKRRLLLVVLYCPLVENWSNNTTNMEWLKGVLRVMQCLGYEPCSCRQSPIWHSGGTLSLSCLVRSLCRGGQSSVACPPPSAVTTGHGRPFGCSCQLDAWVSGAPSVTCREEIPGNLYCALDSLPYSNAPDILISAPCTQLNVFLVNSGRLGGELWGSQISASTFYLGLNFSTPTLGLHFLAVVAEHSPFVGERLPTRKGMGHSLC